MNYAIYGKDVSFQPSVILWVVVFLTDLKIINECLFLIIKFVENIIFILTFDKYPSDSLDRSSDPVVGCADIQAPVLPGQVGQLYLLPGYVPS